MIPTDSLPQDIDQLIALFSDVEPRTRGFYKSTFSKTGVIAGPGYLERLAESLHRQGENLLALMILGAGCQTSNPTRPAPMKVCRCCHSRSGYCMASTATAKPGNWLCQ